MFSHLQQTERSVAHHFGNRVDEIQQMTTELEHTNTMVFDETIQLEQTKDKTERCLQEKVSARQPHPYPRPLPSTLPTRAGSRHGAPYSIVFP